MQLKTSQYSLIYTPSPVLRIEENTQGVVSDENVIATYGIYHTPGTLPAKHKEAVLALAAANVCERLATQSTLTIKDREAYKSRANDLRDAYFLAVRTDINVHDIKKFFNINEHVNDVLIAQHAYIAYKRVQQETGIEKPENDKKTDFQEAVYTACYISVLPYLNTFTLDGAHTVARAAGGSTARFLTASEQQAFIKNLKIRYSELLKNLLNDFDGNDSDIGGFFGVVI